MRSDGHGVITDPEEITAGAPQHRVRAGSFARQSPLYTPTVSARSAGWCALLRPRERQDASVSQSLARMLAARRGAAALSVIQALLNRPCPSGRHAGMRLSDGAKARSKGHGKASGPAAARRREERSLRDKSVTWIQLE